MLVRCGKLRVPLDDDPLAIGNQFLGDQRSTIDRVELAVALDDEAFGCLAPGDARFDHCMALCKQAVALDDHALALGDQLLHRRGTIGLSHQLRIALGDQPLHLSLIVVATRNLRITLDDNPLAIGDDLLERAGAGHCRFVFPIDGVLGIGEQRSQRCGRRQPVRTSRRDRDEVDGVGERGCALIDGDPLRFHFLGTCSAAQRPDRRIEQQSLPIPSLRTEVPPDQIPELRFVQFTNMELVVKIPFV